jgi:hypothetical protein
MNNADSKDEEVREEVEVMGGLSKRRKKVGLNSESTNMMKKMECLAKQIYFDQRNASVDCRGEK